MCATCHQGEGSLQERCALAKATGEKLRRDVIMVNN